MGDSIATRLMLRKHGRVNAKKAKAARGSRRFLTARGLTIRSTVLTASRTLQIDESTLAFMSRFVDRHPYYKTIHMQAGYNVVRYGPLAGLEDEIEYIEASFADGTGTHKLIIKRVPNYIKTANEALREFAHARDTGLFDSQT